MSQIIAVALLIYGITQLVSVLGTLLAELKDEAKSNDNGQR